MNEKWLKTIYTLAFLSYAISLVLYIPKLYHYIDINDLPQVFNYSTVICAFLALSWYTFINAKNILFSKKVETDFKDTSSLYHSPARLGYALLVLNFVIILGISWSKGEPIYFQRLIALAGYLCLAFKIDIGTFLIIIFYIINLFLGVKVDAVDYMLAVSKFIQIFYYGTYAYKYVSLQMEKKAASQNKVK